MPTDDCLGLEGELLQRRCGSGGGGAFYLKGFW